MSNMRENAAMLNWLGIFEARFPPAGSKGSGHETADDASPLADPLETERYRQPRLVEAMIVWLSRERREGTDRVPPREEAPSDERANNKTRPAS